MRHVVLALVAVAPWKTSVTLPGAGVVARPWLSQPPGFHGGAPRSHIGPW